MNTMTKNILAILAALLCLSACEGFLTKDAENQTTEEDWWYNKSMLQTVVDQCYAPMPGGTLTSGAQDVSQATTDCYWNSRIEMEGLSDNGVTVANYVDYATITYGQVQNNHKGIDILWTMRWATIRRCCRYLENWHRAIIDPDSVPWEGIQTVDRWAAEVRALRAYYHLEAYMLWGEIPIVDHVVTVKEMELERKSRADVVAWIATEFEEASKNLPVKPQVNDERWRWTKGACYAYLSYLYMFESDWTNALAWAQKVIDLGIYDIYLSPSNPAGSYNEQFHYDAYTNNTKESILTKHNGLRQAIQRLLPPSVKSGTSGISPISSLVDAYEMLDGTAFEELSAEDQAKYHLDPTPAERDPRLAQTIYFPGESYLGLNLNCWNYGTTDYIGARNSTKSGYWVKKYLNTTDLSRATGNAATLPFQLMRYSVILLNYVECQIELGNINDPNIYIYLNKIRKRAGMPEVDEAKYNTQAKLRELVRRERRVELAYEGHRYIDIKRWKIGNEVMNGPVYGAKNPETGELQYVEERRFNPDRDYVWPIPIAEISTNNNIDQNPGY